MINQNYQAYCVRCKKKVDVKDPKIVQMKNSKGVRRAVKGTCSTCGTKLTAFIKRE